MPIERVNSGEKWNDKRSKDSCKSKKDLKKKIQKCISLRKVEFATNEILVVHKE